MWTILSLVYYSWLLCSIWEFSAPLKVSGHLFLLHDLRGSNQPPSTRRQMTLCCIKWERPHRIPTLPIPVSEHLKPDSVWTTPPTGMSCEHCLCVRVCVCTYLNLLVWTCLARFFFFSIDDLSSCVWQSLSVKQWGEDTTSASLSPPLSAPNHRRETPQAECCSSLNMTVLQWRLQNAL